MRAPPTLIFYVQRVLIRENTVINMVNISNYCAFFVNHTFLFTFINIQHIHFKYNTSSFLARTYCFMKNYLTTQNSHVFKISCLCTCSHTSYFYIVQYFPCNVQLQYHLKASYFLSEVVIKHSHKAYECSTQNKNTKLKIKSMM